MAKRRRTSNVQRQRASAEALNRRIDQGSASALPDWRLLLIGGVIVVGVLILALVLIFGGGPKPRTSASSIPTTETRTSRWVPTVAPRRRAIQTAAPTRTPRCRRRRARTGTRAASRTGASTRRPQPETQLIHNLEHGGIVIWYDPEALTVESIDALTGYVQNQNASGSAGDTSSSSARGAASDPLPAPVVATAWRWSLELETADIDAIDEFARAHYGEVARAERRSRAARLTPN